ncbi:hypothetical protein J437_LFUL002101 [Ladona fulva]|uniref:N-acetyltransferase domain-containing protein n=1 Tax=Ladona fulva TaxID=123851 RepID=A0A8K0K0Y3_LADFU|nr:hypothetical protein J437_LFUL002101 [Ladona fulva]
MEYSDSKGNVEETGWRITEADDTFLKGSLRWSSLRPGIKTTLFCPIQPEWKDGLIIDVRGHVYGVSVLWPYDDFSVLSSALRSDAIIDWQSRPKVFFGIPRTFEPEGVIFKKLNISHASKVNSTWPGARQQSLKFIEDMISINQSVGLFTENDSEPISWILESFYGLGSLFTVMEHRLKGYGAISVTALAKILGNEGKNVTAMVREQNLSAQKLFKKVGFQPSGVLKVIQTCENTYR